MGINPMGIDAIKFLLDVQLELSLYFSNKDFERLTPAGLVHELIKRVRRNEEILKEIEKLVEEMLLNDLDLEGLKEILKLVTQN